MKMKIPVYILIICAAVLMTAGVSTASYNFDRFLVVTRTIDTGDVILLSNYVGYPRYSLNCT